jgi:hypothetical protein
MEGELGKTGKKCPDFGTKFPFFFKALGKGARWIQ